MKICLNCNNEIKKGKYCSQNCYQGYKNKTVIKCECQNCGREFQSEKLLLNHVNKTCRGRCVCGNTILRGKNYCSQDCYNKFVREDPEWKYKITNAAHEKTKELGKQGKHWCQLGDEKARNQIKKFREAGVDASKELGRQNKHWTQIDKEKLNIAQEKAKPKIIEKLTGRTFSIESRKRMSESRKGCTFSDEHRANLSRVRIEKGLARGEKNPRYGKSPTHTHGYKHGYREDLGHYVRSSWEANYARILKYLNISYEYEFKRMVLIKPDGEKTTYLPDFKIGETYIEIKGRWVDDAREKLGLFQQQYPNIKLIIVEPSKYIQLIKFYKYKIKNWE